MNARQQNWDAWVLRSLQSSHHTSCSFSEKEYVLLHCFNHCYSESWKAKPATFPIHEPLACFPCPLQTRLIYPIQEGPHDLSPPACHCCLELPHEMNPGPLLPRGWGMPSCPRGLFSEKWMCLSSLTPDMVLVACELTYSGEEGNGEYVPWVPGKWAWFAEDTQPQIRGGSYIHNLCSFGGSVVQTFTAKWGHHLIQGYISQTLCPQWLPAGVLEEAFWKEKWASHVPSREAHIHLSPKAAPSGLYSMLRGQVSSPSLAYPWNGWMKQSLGTKWTPRGRRVSWLTAQGPGPGCDGVSASLLPSWTTSEEWQGNLLKAGALHLCKE